jgi:DDE superfamily endonuclease
VDRRHRCSQQGDTRGGRDATIYCGQVGKQENCQVAVSLSLANHHASLPAAYRLYLPEDWATNAKRRGKTGVPKEIVFKTLHPANQTDKASLFLTQSYYEGQSFVLQTGNFSTHHPSRHWRRSRDRRRRAERHHRRPRWVTTRDARTSPACDCDILRAATCTAMPLILAYGASQGYDKSEWRPIGGCSLQLEC